MRFESTSGGFITWSPCPAELVRRIDRIERDFLAPFLRLRGFRLGRDGTFRKLSPSHIWIVGQFRWWGSDGDWMDLELGVYHRSWMAAIDRVLWGEVTAWRTTPSAAASLVPYETMHRLAGVDRALWAPIGGGQRTGMVGRRVIADLKKYAFDWFRANSFLSEVVERLATRTEHKRGSWHGKVYATCGYAVLGNKKRAAELCDAAIDDDPPEWCDMKAMQPPITRLRALRAALHV